MLDLDAIVGTLPHDFLYLIIIFLDYWMTNILKDKYRLPKHDVHLVAVGLGIVFNLLRSIANGTSFPSGIASLPEILLYGILVGILATGSHKLIKAICARLGLPQYGETAEEAEAPIILSPTIDRDADAPDPASAATPEHTENPVY